MGKVIELILEEGKYTFRLDTKTGELICLRYGEPWRDFVGDKAVFALFMYAVEHLAHVQGFLQEMWATMGDPVEDFTGDVKELTEALLKLAREHRESIAKSKS